MVFCSKRYLIGLDERPTSNRSVRPTVPPLHHPRPGILQCCLKGSDLCGHCLRSAPGTASPSVYKMRLRARTLTDQIKSESSQSSAIE